MFVLDPTPNSFSPSPSPSLSPAEEAKARASGDAPEDETESASSDIFFPVEDETNEITTKDYNLLRMEKYKRLFRLLVSQGMQKARIQLMYIGAQISDTNSHGETSLMVAF